jgi:ABC-2 type transport system ATP-binding protein
MAYGLPGRWGAIPAVMNSANAYGVGIPATAGILTTRVVPTSRRAFLAGIDVAAHPALAKQLSGIVSQQNTLDRQLTVWENLYFHGRLFGVGGPPAAHAGQ